MKKYKKMKNIYEKLTLLTYKKQTQYFKDQGIPAILINKKCYDYERIAILIFVRSYEQLEKFEPSPNLYNGFYPTARKDVLRIIESKNQLNLPLIIRASFFKI